MIKPYPYTTRLLLPKVDEILRNGLTVDLVALIKEKSIGGLSSLACGDIQSARLSHAEAFGAHNLWLKQFFDELMSLDSVSRQHLDNHIFEHLGCLDEALAWAESA